MSAVLISCWAGMGNVGDDWLLRVALDRVEASKVGVLLESSATLPTYANGCPVLRWPPLRPVTPETVWAWRRFRRELTEWSAIVSFGGGWLAGDQGVETLGRWLLRFRLASRPVFGVELSVGPFPSRRSRHLGHNLLKTFDILTVRSNADAEEVERLLHRAPLVVGDGVLFDKEYSHEQPRVPRRGVVVAAARPYDHWLYRDAWSAYAERIALVASKLVEPTESVSFVSFQKPDDAAFWKPYGKVITPIDVSTALDLVRNARVVIASRFHATLAAVIASVPVVPIGYHQKFTSLEEFGIRALSIKEFMSDDRVLLTRQNAVHSNRVLEHARDRWSELMKKVSERLVG